MFKSFFPKPKLFFLSAFIWALIAVVFWQAGGQAWIMRLVGASEDVPISAARFWSLNFLLFYAYYALCVGLFALFWFFYAPHRWQRWSILCLGYWTALMIRFQTHWKPMRSSSRCCCRNSAVGRDPSRAGVPGCPASRYIAPARSV